jgi:hypothetical protein
MTLPAATYALRPSGETRTSWGLWPVGSAASVACVAPSPARHASRSSRRRSAGPPRREPPHALRSLAPRPRGQHMRRPRAGPAARARTGRVLQQLHPPHAVIPALQSDRRLLRLDAAQLGGLEEGGEDGHRGLAGILACACPEGVHHLDLEGPGEARPRSAHVRGSCRSRRPAAAQPGVGAVTGTRRIVECCRAELDEVSGLAERPAGCNFFTPDTVNYSVWCALAAAPSLWLQALTSWRARCTGAPHPHGLFDSPHRSCPSRRSFG